jgi:hypothetical protein
VFLCSSSPSALPSYSRSRSCTQCNPFKATTSSDCPSTATPPPALRPCSSRKGTVDTAAVLAKAASLPAPGSGTLPAAGFVRSAEHASRLAAAGGRVQARALAAALAAAVGFHNAAMEPADREVVEGLFRAGDLGVRQQTAVPVLPVDAAPAEVCPHISRSSPHNHLMRATAGCTSGKLH